MSDPEKSGSSVKSFLSIILLILSAASLFALANPNSMITDGVPLCAWFMYVPLFFLAERTSCRTVWLCFGTCGVISYCLYTSWLAVFSLQAMAAACMLYFILYAVLGLLMRTAYVYCGAGGWVEESLLLCSFEYVKTLGFAGFSYGVSGYTQWNNTSLIQIASVTGVWGVSALIVFSAALIYAVWSKAERMHGIRSVVAAARYHLSGILVWTACLCAAFAFGVYAEHASRAAAGKTVHVCAVQHNSDPWKGGADAYEEDAKKLMRLTDSALSEDSGVQIVVWPETAVVPSILLQYHERKDRKRFAIVSSVLESINRSSAVFVIGNFNSVRTGSAYNADYNSAFVFTPGKNVIPPEPEVYSKVHLVPFTEYFPYGNIFPHIYKLLLNGDTHMWTPGTERTVFAACGVSFAVPICFEDTFGNDCREFVNNGARLFINISNDAWSKSLACQKQHLSMAVFRSVESRVPSVRSTASGQTCIIDECGHVVKEAEPFVAAYVEGSVRVNGWSAGATVYDKAGDLPVRIAMAASFLWLVSCIIWNKTKKRGTIQV